MKAASSESSTRTPSSPRSPAKTNDRLHHRGKPGPHARAPAVVAEPRDDRGRDRRCDGDLSPDGVADAELARLARLALAQPLPRQPAELARGRERQEPSELRLPTDP